MFELLVLVVFWEILICIGGIIVLLDGCFLDICEGDCWFVIGCINVCKESFVKIVERDIIYIDSV